MYLDGLGSVKRLEFSLSLSLVEISEFASEGLAVVG